jgi:hypothetical protein
VEEHLRIQAWKNAAEFVRGRTHALVRVEEHILPFMPGDLEAFLLIAAPYGTSGEMNSPEPHSFAL